MLGSGNFFFRFRNALFPLVFVGLFLFTRPASFLNSPFLDRLVVWLGVAMALAGQCFRLVVIGYAYIKRGGREGKVYADELVVRGFYAHCRNPMYVGNFLITAGLGLVYGAPQVYFLVIPFFSYVYLSIVMAEENYLRSKFGQQYEDYVKRVNRFVPRFQGIGESLKELTYDWKKAIRKDYGTLFGVLFGIVFISLWKAYCLFGFQERKKEILDLALFLFILGLLYFLIRYLKLTKRLGS